MVLSCRPIGRVGLASYFCHGFVTLVFVWRANVKDFVMAIGLPAAAGDRINGVKHLTVVITIEEGGCKSGSDKPRKNFWKFQLSNFIRMLSQALFQLALRSDAQTKINVAILAYCGAGENS